MINGVKRLDITKRESCCALSESINDVVTAEGGTALNFGSVQRVYETSDKTTVGDSVLFNINKSTPFTIISGNVFYLIDETDIQFTETIIPPP